MLNAAIFEKVTKKNRDEGNEQKSKQTVNQSNEKINEKMRTEELDASLFEQNDMLKRELGDDWKRGCRWKRS